MKWRWVFVAALIFIVVIGVREWLRLEWDGPSESELEKVRPGEALAAPGSCPSRPLTDSNQCGGGPCVVDFKQSASSTTNAQALQDFKNSAGRENTTLRLGPTVELDFSHLPANFFPIQFGRCTTLISVAAFEPEPVVLAHTVQPSATSDIARSVSPERVIHGLAAALEPEVGSARTPSSLGPVLRFGTDHPTDQPDEKPPMTFLEVKCQGETLHDGVRISGVRVFGPSFGYQTTDEVGIRIIDCVGIEISNMEIAGWGGSAIGVQSPGARLVSFQDVKILGNFLHHNQHPSKDGHAGGYGVDVGAHASALIAENVFDFNRHSIAASGDSFGYDAERNLVLKGGGYHGGFGNRWTHQFDVHGNAHSALPTAWCWIKDNLCFWCDDCEHASTYDRGDASNDLMFSGNVFQYRNDNAIKIRGRPRLRARIEHNVFPHDGLENDWGDDAIALQTSENVTLGPGNKIEIDTYGKYGVCDFDGDAVDDLFLATGQTWWYSSFGEFQWSFLNAREEQLNALRLGYFDDDRRCDVLTESGNEWIIFSGGYGPPRSLGAFGARLSEVEFGRFDPDVRDYRPGKTRRTTHAFRRMTNGEWQVTPLSAPDWRHAQSSSFPMDKLRFGDFTGDGITDVLAVEGGHWSISESAHNTWRPLNPSLRDDVKNVYIANMDADDNIDDILRLERKSKTVSLNNQKTEQTTLVWWRSKNGVEPWREYKRFEFSFPVAPNWKISPWAGFAGRFGIAPGGGVMVIDEDRRGRFYSHTENSPDWKSLFSY